MRKIVSVVMVISYVFAFNVYIYEITSGSFTHRRSILLYYYALTIFLFYLVIDVKLGKLNNIHKRWNNFGFTTVFCHFLLIILNHHGFFEDAFSLFTLFNLSLIISALNFYNTTINSSIIPSKILVLYNSVTKD
jgi:hypothetical protein